MKQQIIEEEKKEIEEEKKDNPPYNNNFFQLSDEQRIQKKVKENRAKHMYIVGSSISQDVGINESNLSIADHDNSLFFESEGRVNKDKKKPHFLSLSMQNNRNSRRNRSLNGSFISNGSSSQGEKSSSFSNYSFHAESEKAKQRDKNEHSENKLQAQQQIQRAMKPKEEKPPKLAAKQVGSI